MAQVLTINELKSMAPSIFSTGQAEDLSDKYMRVDTLDIISTLEKSGFVPVRASQSHNRVEAKAKYATHTVDFRHESQLNKAPLIVGDSPIFPEIKIVNGYSGEVQLNIMAGLFRMVCSNGLTLPVTEGSSIQAKLKHQDFNKSKLESMIMKLEGMQPDTLSNLSRYQTIMLTDSQKVKLAETMLRYRFEVDNMNFNYEEILKPLRSADERNDLFTVMNVIQEKLIKGGITAISKSSNRVMLSKSIRNVLTDIEINQGIYRTMDTFADTSEFVYFGKEEAKAA